MSHSNGPRSVGVGEGDGGFAPSRQVRPRPLRTILAEPLLALPFAIALVSLWFFVQNYLHRFPGETGRLDPVLLRASMVLAALSALVAVARATYVRFVFRAGRIVSGRVVGTTAGDGRKCPSVEIVYAAEGRECRLNASLILRKDFLKISPGDEVSLLIARRCPDRAYLLLPYTGIKKLPEGLDGTSPTARPSMSAESRDHV